MQLDRYNFSFLGEVAPWDVDLSARLQLWVPGRPFFYDMFGYFFIQSTFDFHTDCSRILALIITGANHPRMSYVFAISDTEARFVRDSWDEWLATLSLKWYKTECHSTHNVFVQTSSWSVMVGDVWLSLSSGGTSCRMLRLLEFHFHSRKSALVNSSCSWWRS